MKNKLKTLGLFALLLVVSVYVIFGATGAWIIHTFTLDKSVSPWLQTAVESVYVFIYEDDGVTKLDSVYTDEWGYAMVTMDSAQDGESHIRFTIDTTYGSTVYQTYTIRLATAGADTLLDTIPVSLRMYANPGCSTSVVSFTLIEGDGGPASGVSVTCYTSTPYKDVAGNHMTSSNGNNQFVQSTTSATSGLVEITVVDSTLNQLRIGAYQWTPIFEVTTDMTLGNIVYSPK
jgi:hypothetical protein